MNRICGAIVIVALSVAAAEISIGGNVGTSLITERDIVETDQDRETRSTGYALQIIPAVVISPQSMFEIVPQAGFLVQVGKRTQETQGNENTNEWTDLGFGGGVGLFFRLAESGPLRFSLGPDVWYWLYNPDGDDNTTHEMLVGVPVNLDFIFTPRFFIRASARLAVVGYWRQNQNADRFRDRITFFDINSLWTPTLGFFLTF